jgi:SAM-dependent methyltransferase
MQISARALIRGVATFVPGVMNLACRGSGGTDSPRYCYSVWLRHLTRLAEVGFDTHFETVAELGPGDSLGIGLSAMLTGANRYFAFDALPHARKETNLQTLERLVELFSRQERLPGVDQFPEISPSIVSLDFPRATLDGGRLDAAMRPQRLAAIRRALEFGDVGEVEIRYAAPWTDSSVLRSEDVDLVFSQAVLEHVENIAATYDALFRWLRPGGVMSHQIDFKSHGLTRDWYGHWTLPSWVWRLVRGRRSYLINRLPASAHMDAMQRAGFEIAVQIPIPASSSSQESRRFAPSSDAGAPLHLENEHWRCRGSACARGSRTRPAWRRGRRGDGVSGSP